MSDLLDECFETDEVRTSVIHSLDMHNIDQPGVLFGYASIKANLLVDPHNQGIVKGGNGNLEHGDRTRGRKALAQKFGAGAQVKRILIEKDGVHGVELTDGQIFHSRRVISNADPKRLFGSGGTRKIRPTGCLIH